MANASPIGLLSFEIIALIVPSMTALTLAPVDVIVMSDALHQSDRFCGHEKIPTSIMEMGIFIYIVYHFTLLSHSHLFG